MSYMQLLCCRDFIKSQVRKGKNFIRVFSKQYGFASQDFLIVRSNGWVGWLAHPPLVGGGGVSLGVAHSQGCVALGVKKACHPAGGM